MDRNEVRHALKHSLGREAVGFKERFDKADTIISAVKNKASQHSPPSLPASAVVEKKVVRCGFCMPEEDVEVIETLKKRYMSLGENVSKSEVIRAGVRVLLSSPDGQLKKALEGLSRFSAGVKGPISKASKH